MGFSHAGCLSCHPTNGIKAATEIRKALKQFCSGGFSKGLTQQVLGIERGQACRHAAADRHTDTETDTQTRMTTIHFASSTTHAKCNQSWNAQVTVHHADLHHTNELVN